MATFKERISKGWALPSLASPPEVFSGGETPPPPPKALKERAIFSNENKVSIPEFENRVSQFVEVRDAIPVDDDDDDYGDVKKEEDKLVQFYKNDMFKGQVEEAEEKEGEEVQPVTSAIDTQQRVTLDNIPLAIVVKDSFVIGFDPGLTAAGLALIHEQTSRANLYLIDFKRYVKKLTTAADKKRAIVCMLYDFQHIFRLARVVAIEKQRISVPAVKAIAKQTCAAIRHYFPNTEVLEVDPKITRAFWGITVKASDYDKKYTQQQLYKIRKTLSANTCMISKEDMPRIQKHFTIKTTKGSRFYVDEIDAALIGFGFIKCEKYIRSVIAKAGRFPLFSRMKTVNRFESTPRVVGIQLHAPDVLSDVQIAKTVYEADWTDEEKDKDNNEPEEGEEEEEEGENIEDTENEVEEDEEEDADDSSWIVNDDDEVEEKKTKRKRQSSRRPSSHKSNKRYKKSLSEPKKAQEVNNNSNNNKKKRKNMDNSELPVTPLTDKITTRQLPCQPCKDKRIKRARMASIASDTSSSESSSSSDSSDSDSSSETDDDDDASTSSTSSSDSSSSSSSDSSSDSSSSSSSSDVRLVVPGDNKASPRSGSSSSTSSSSSESDDSESDDDDDDSGTPDSASLGTNDTE